MKHRLITLALALLAAQAGFACQSTDAGTSTGESIRMAADKIELGVKQLDETLLALHAIVDSPGQDLNAQRKAYENALAALENTSKDVGSKSDDMNAKGKAYFAEWDAQIASIQNEEIRERSAERRKAIEASFSDLREKYEQTRGAFQPLMNDLRDVRTALQADTTMGGLESLKPVVKKVDKEAKNAKEELAELVEDFRKLGLDLARSGPAPKPATDEKK